MPGFKEYRVTAFFNDALGGSFAPGVNEDSDLRYMASQSKREYVPSMDGYVQGKAVLVRSKLGEQFVRAYMPDEAADMLFAVMNRDDRPNGLVERSLSVGDVVLVEPWDLGPVGTYYYAVCPVGYKLINPTHEEFEN